MHRIFVDPHNITPEKITLEGNALKKVRRVLRLKLGDNLWIFDGSGAEYLTQIISFSPSAAELRIIETAQPVRESPLEIHLGQALPKASKMDLIVQKAVELGVTSIHPFYSTRTVPLYEKDQVEKRVRRWQKIAREASRQSGRTNVPDVDSPVEFAHLLGAMPNRGIKLILQKEYAREPMRAVLQLGKKTSCISFLVGPEGGFTAQEIALAVDSGFAPVSLGGRILRTETVALAFLSIAQYALGDIH
jgi:16S rRNA (uracil1498-N3)-methyltransferase